MNKERLYEIRTRKSMTLEKLSEDTGIPVGTLSKISSGISKPSYDNMCLIAKALNCSLDEFSDDSNYKLTDDELFFISQFRKLSNHSKKMVHTIIELELDMSELHSYDESCYLECLVPTNLAGDGTFYESCTVSIVDMGNAEVAKLADFCLRMVTDALYPVYYKNDVLLIKYRFPKMGETAIFIHNHKQYIRMYYPTKTSVKLVALNKFSKDIVVSDLRDYVCVGTVITVYRGEMKVITENKYKKNLSEV